MAETPAGKRSPAKRAPSARDTAAIFRSVLEQSPLPMAATEGPSHLLRYANPAFSRLVGRTEKETIGRALPSFLGETEVGDTLALLDRVYRSGGAASVAVFRGGDAGPVIHATYAAWVVPDERAHPSGLLLQVIDTSHESLAKRQAAEFAEELRDVSRRLLQAGLKADLRAETHLALNSALRETEKRLELALAEQERLLASEQVARGHAEMALRVRDQFLAIAAHELRSPLTAIKATAQLAARGAERGTLDTERAGRYLRNIVESSGQLEGLLGDLLDVSRMRAEGPSAWLVPLELGALVRAVSKHYEVSAGQHRIVCRVPSQSIAVAGDAGRLKQLLDNLFANAVKYSPDGGEISVHLRRANGGALITVRDAGIGLPEGEEERIFEPFRRAPNAVARGLPGWGLGLHISRQIAEAHGGTLRAESKGEGAGTTMLLWLPMMKTSAE